MTTAETTFTATLAARAATMTTAELVSLRDSAERVAIKLAAEGADHTRIAAAWVCWRVYSEIVAAR
ncbi:MAG: hypothetical protein EBR82_73085 [Caulobacteraceae bacterium]|nr:hypothetical protein [Caulobacteraceae bacterium]